MNHTQSCTISSWVREELNEIDIGDTRLNERAMITLERLGAKPNESIPNAFLKGWAEIKAAYRFFDNEKVTAEKILAPHKQATIERIKQEKVVLLPQDTTQFHFDDADLKGIGPMSRGNEKGFLTHLSMAVTPSGINLGIISNKSWSRKELGKSKDKDKKQFEEKESYRWLEGLRIAHDVAQQVPKTQVVSVADREGDIYELYLALDEMQSKNLHYLARISHNRNLEDEPSDEDTIWEKISQAELLGHIEIVTPRNSTKKSRAAILSLRASRMTLKPPKRERSAALMPVEMTVILAEEENPPKGEKPIQWLLMTDLEVDTLEGAIEKLNWYVCRWTIEVYFRILKTGCRVEELQLEHFDRIQVCMSLYMIVAWRIQMLIKLGKELPDLPCDALFDDAEWKAAYIVKYQKEPPEKVPTLGEMCRIIAMFGGFIGRKSDGFPGPQTLWIGLQRVRDFEIALAVSRVMCV